MTPEYNLGYTRVKVDCGRFLGKGPGEPTHAKGDTEVNMVTPFLMFDDQLEAALEFYIATFPDSEVKNVARTVKDGPIISAEFVVGGQSFMGYNGGPHFRFSELLAVRRLRESGRGRRILGQAR